VQQRQLRAKWLLCSTRFFAFVSSLKLSRRLLCSVCFVFVSTFNLLTRKSICRWNHQFEQIGCLCKGKSSGRYVAVLPTLPVVCVRIEVVGPDFEGYFEEEGKKYPLRLWVNMYQIVRRHIQEDRDFRVDIFLVFIFWDTTKSWGTLLVA